MSGSVGHVRVRVDEWVSGSCVSVSASVSVSMSVSVSVECECECEGPCPPVMV